jgi:hypothetical protein
MHFRRGFLHWATWAMSMEIGNPVPQAGACIASDDRLLCDFQRLTLLPYSQSAPALCWA